jgi:hypothetical protein
MCLSSDAATSLRQWRYRSLLTVAGLSSWVSVSLWTEQLLDMSSPTRHLRATSSGSMVGLHHLQAGLIFDSADLTDPDATTYKQVQEYTFWVRTHFGCAVTCVFGSGLSDSSVPL